MRIGIASPVSSFYFQNFLYENSKEYAKLLSRNDGPAVTNLILNFLRQGHSVVVFTIDPYATEDLVLRGENLVVYVIKQNVRMFQRLYSILLFSGFIIAMKMRSSKEKLDVMSSHWTREYAIASRFYFGKCPVTCTVRDILPEISKYIYFPKTFKLKNEITMRCKKYHFISNSEYTAAMVKKYWGHESYVAYNGISNMFLETGFAKKNDVFTYVSIASFVDERKNIDTLLHAFQFVRKKCANVQLFLVGNDFVNGNEKVESWRKEGLLDCVNLMGKLDRLGLRDVLLGAHCVVHPSFEESFGNVLIEAMACRCFVVGGIQSGAVPYVLGNGKYGFLCDVRSSDELAKTMIMVREKPDLSILDRASYAVRLHYSPESVANRYLEFFEKIRSTEA